MGWGESRAIKPDYAQIMAAAIRLFLVAPTSRNRERLEGALADYDGRRP